MMEEVIKAHQSIHAAIMLSNYLPPLPSYGEQPGNDIMRSLVTNLSNSIQNLGVLLVSARGDQTDFRLDLDSESESASLLL
jgi:hypothetical protein